MTYGTTHACEYDILIHNIQLYIFVEYITHNVLDCNKLNVYTRTQLTTLKFIYLRMLYTVMHYFPRKGVILIVYVMCL